MNSNTSLVLQKQVEEESESQGSNDKAPQITLEGPSCQAVACGLTNFANLDIYSGLTRKSELREAKIACISEMIGPNIRVNESQLGVPFKNGINSP